MAYSIQQSQVITLIIGVDDSLLDLTTVTYLQSIDILMEFSNVDLRNMHFLSDSSPIDYEHMLAIIKEGHLGNHGLLGEPTIQVVNCEAA